MARGALVRVIKFREVLLMSESGCEDAIRTIRLRDFPRSSRSPATFPDKRCRVGLHIVLFAACLNYPPLDGSSITASESFPHEPHQLVDLRGPLVPSARCRCSITSASLLPSRGAATRAGWPQLTLAAARKAVEALIGRMAAGFDVNQEHRDKIAKAKAPKPLTLAELVDRWEREGWAQQRDSYRKRALASVRYTFRPMMRTPITDLSGEAIEAVLDEAINRGPAAARMAGISLRTCVNWGVSSARSRSRRSSRCPRRPRSASGC